MLSHEKQIVCINIADSLFHLFYNDIFLLISNTLQLWNNYELLFVIEIPEEKNIVAAKMNKCGLIYCFPDDTYLFENFIEYKTSKSYERLQQENPPNITTIEEIEKVFKFITTQPIDFDDKSSRNDMTLSLFYHENENIAGILNNIIFKSAIKNILRILFIYEPEVNLLLEKMIAGKYSLHDSIDGPIEEEWDELLKTQGISLYIETKCIFEEGIPPEHERIYDLLNLTPLIKYQYRRFYTEEGIYCPLGRSETLPQFQKQIISGSKIFQKIINMERNFDVFKKDQKELIHSIKIEQKKPAFYDNLDNDQNKRYDEIFKKIHEIYLPINKNNEKDQFIKYENLITLLGIFAGKLISSVLKPKKGNVTIKEIKSLGLTKNDFKISIKDTDWIKIMDYSENKCSVYNPIRHDKNRESNIIETKRFIQDTHEILDLIVNNYMN